jgi:serine protease Do
LVASGKVSTFTVSRQGKHVEVKVTIGSRPEEKLAANEPAGPAIQPSSATAAGLGLASLTPQAKKAFNLGDDVKAGAVITKVDPNSDAAEKGLQPGDVVLRIGNRAVRAPADVSAGIAEAQKGGRSSILLLVARQQGGTGFVAIDINKT